MFISNCSDKKCHNKEDDNPYQASCFSINFICVFAQDFFSRNLVIRQSKLLVNRQDLSRALLLIDCFPELVHQPLRFFWRIQIQPQTLFEALLDGHSNLNEHKPIVSSTRPSLIVFFVSKTSMTLLLLGTSSLNTVLFTS